MAYALLWIESLATILLLFAAALAFGAQVESRWRSILAPTLTALLSLAFGASAVVASVILHTKFNMKNDWLYYSASWFAALLIGLIFIRKRAGKMPFIGAANWPRARLNIAFFAAFALTCSTYWNIDASIRSKLAFARQEGHQMFMLVSPPSLPDEINAALVYEKAFVEYMRLMREFRAKQNTPTRGWAAWETNFQAAGFPVTDPELAAFLTERQALIATLKRASAMTTCSFDRDFVEPNMASLLLPELSSFRSAARLLAGDARWKAATGRMGEALEDIAAIERMAAHVGAQPILVAALVAISLDTIASSALEGILATATPTAADLAPLQKEKLFIVERVMYRALKGEEAFGLTMFADVGDGASDVFTLDAFVSDTESANSNLKYLTSPWRVFLAADDVASYRRYMEKLRKSVGQNTEARMHNKISLKDGLENARQLQADISMSPGGPLTRLLPPSITRIVENMVRAEARQRLTKLAVAFAAYHARNKQWPDQPGALVPEFLPEIPLDPFDDKTMRVKKTGNKILLYSVGPKQTDDGGIEPDPTKRNDATDNIVFRLGNE